MVKSSLPMSEPYTLTTLSNGLRIITIPMAGVQSVGEMVWVSAGTRHETKKVNGIAHFLEHMVFKGTKKFKNSEVISRTVEGIGGILNAYTDTEFTAYWCKVTKQHFDQGLDLISQLAIYPTLPATEIKKESGNVIEEINRREDRPDEIGLEEFFSLLYPDQPFGRATLGTKEIVSSLRRSDFERFRQSHYSPDKMTVVIAGAVTPAQVEKSVRSIFGNLKRYSTVPAVPVVERQKVPGVRLYYKETTAQAHIYLGARAFAQSDPDRSIFYVLNSILGQGMSSRLFLNVREKKGLAYSVSSETALYSDAGLWVAYAGLNKEKMQDGIGGILEEMKRIREVKVGEKELTEAKEKIRGPLVFLLENPFKVAEFYGLKAVTNQELEGPEQEAEAVMAVTAEDVRRVAQRLFTNARLNLAVVGPYKPEEKERFLKVLRIN
ncbi:MAG: Peptidase M16 domain protein [Microgenomates group bacterium GW2011_GWA1_Microgenomates_45_10]|nr:MAG: Peptidase M16 domain protein [Microgenomates group bacterium GW2011_GWA1_Microgenomates_45_10]